MHTINTFLFGDPSGWSGARIYDLVKQRFGQMSGVEFSELVRPFGISPALNVTFDKKYSFTVSYIDNDSVRQSVANVERVTSTKLPVEKLAGEVRTTFGDDKDLDFDHVTMYMYELLGSLPGSAVYDDNHKDFVWPPQLSLSPDGSSAHNGI